MKVFAIGDLHLSLAADKPMNVFGPAWEDHANRIAEAWRSAVAPEDVVLVPGDISWAMQLPEAAQDLAFVGSLPGRKVLLRGNHDYWWSSLSKVRDALPEGVFALQNDVMHLDGLTVAGSRGWVCPGSAIFDEAKDRKIYDREVLRLELSLSKAQKRDKLICMLHYPPFNEKRARSGFSELMEKYGVDIAVYGHLHDKACRNAFEGERNGVEYRLCSADHLNFSPRLITEL